MTEKKKQPKEVCEYCNHFKVCEFNAFWGKKAYPCCRECIPEAKKDGFIWSKRKA